MPAFCVEKKKFCFKSSANNPIEDRGVPFALVLGRARWAVFLFVMLLFAGLLIAPASAMASSMPKVISFSAGNYMSAAVLEDGSVWTWGYGRYSTGYGRDAGELAAGEYRCPRPNEVIEEGAVSVKCSNTDTVCSPYSGGCASNVAVLRNDGTLWMWGAERYGCLGDGDADKDGHYCSRPFKVLDDVKDYAVGGLCTAAIKTDGTLWMWGNNYYGQLGLGNDGNQATPVQVPGMSDVVQVEISKNSTTVAAVKKDGSLWVWGSNYNFACGVHDEQHLGGASSDYILTPTKILDSVTSVTLGFDFGCALKTDGSVWTWGANSNGELGSSGTGNARPEPAACTEIENIKYVDATKNGAAAIDTSNRLWMWGNCFGVKIGAPRLISTSVAGWGKVDAISMGRDHCLLAKESGEFCSWGCGSRGQLGTDSYKDVLPLSSLPAIVRLGSFDVPFYIDENVGIKYLSSPWSDDALFRANTAYREDLATAGLFLSEAAYNSSGDNSAYDVLTRFGFTRVASKPESEVGEPGYYIAYRAMWNFDNPQVEVIMTIKGTQTKEDIFTDINSVTDTFDAPATYCLNRLQQAKTNIDNDLTAFSAGKSNMHFFITGHSLGGAVAARMALKGVEQQIIKKENTLVYTYAAPNYLAGDDVTFSEQPTMFDIINNGTTLNNGDCFVPGVPSVKVRNVWGPFSTIFVAYKLAPRVNLNAMLNPKYQENLTELYGHVPLDSFGPYGAHMPSRYLAAILAHNQTVTAAKILHPRTISVFCPVDVEVYNPSGELCANTSGDTVENLCTDPVQILIDGDAKLVALPEEGEYTIRYIGTDTGTMKVVEQTYSDDPEQAISTRTFENVALEEGKTFSSLIDDGDETSDMKLVVVDAEGAPVFSVEEDGTEKELSDAQTYHIAFSKNGYDIPGWQTDSVDVAEGDSTVLPDPGKPSGAPLDETGLVGHVYFDAGEGALSPEAKDTHPVLSWGDGCWRDAELNGEKVGAFGEAYTPQGDIDLYADFDKDCAWTEVVLPSVEKEGASLDGWYTKAEGGEKVGAAGDSYIPEQADTTLYAHWTENGGGELAASGMWGTCPWDIDSDGLLTIHPGEGADVNTGDGWPSSYWSEYRDQISSVKFVAEGDKKVKAPACMCGLFCGMGFATIDLAGLDTSATTNMMMMFDSCRYLESIDLSPLDTSHVTKMNWMFRGCEALTEMDMSVIDLSQVGNMNTMFGSCAALKTVDFSGNGTPNLIGIADLFDSCPSLESVDLSGIDISKVNSLAYLFSKCSKLETLDLSGFDTANVTNTCFMFSQCASLKTVYVSDKWNMGNVESSQMMFYGCQSIKGGNGTVFAEAHQDAEYARVDDPENDKPGYLTAKSAPSEMYTVTYDKNGYEFSSWPRESDTVNPGTTVKLPDPGKPDTDGKPTGKTRAVSFNANGGSCETKKEESSEIVTYPSGDWYTASHDGVLAGNFGKDYRPEGSQTLYVCYTESFSWQPVTLPTATLDGSVLDGWYTKAEGGEKVGNQGDAYIPDGPVTLYAHWRTEKPDNPFADVDENTPHVDDVLWLAANGISKGWDEKDGTKTFRPLGDVARADMAAFLFRLGVKWGVVKDTWQPTDEQKKYFADVDDKTPHAREIWWMASAGISKGWDEKDGTKTFRPLGNVARQDMAAFLFRLSKIAGKGGASDNWKASAESKAKFFDVSPTDANNHHDEVWWMAEAGISKGWEENGKCEFRGLRNVARCDMAAFLHRLDEA